MGDPETKNKRSQQRRRNFHAKVMHEVLRPKIIDPRKEEYRRVKLNPREMKEEDDE